MFNNVVRVAGIALLGGVGLYGAYALTSGDGAPEGRDRFAAQGGTSTAPVGTPDAGSSNAAGTAGRGRNATPNNAAPNSAAVQTAGQPTARVDDGRAIAPTTAPDPSPRTDPATDSGPVARADDVAADGGADRGDRQLRAARAEARREVRNPSGESATEAARARAKRFVRNKVRKDKQDRSAYFTENSKKSTFEPCVKADGTPYIGPGTALNPFAAADPCRPRATSDSYAAYSPVAPATDSSISTVALPPTRFVPPPPPPTTPPGSDYTTA